MKKSKDSLELKKSAYEVSLRKVNKNNEFLLNKLEKYNISHLLNMESFKKLINSVKNKASSDNLLAIMTELNNSISRTLSQIDIAVVSIVEESFNLGNKRQVINKVYTGLKKLIPAYKNINKNHSKLEKDITKFIGISDINQLTHLSKTLNDGVNSFSNVLNAQEKLKKADEFDYYALISERKDPFLSVVKKIDDNIQEIIKGINDNQSIESNNTNAKRKIKVEISTSLEKLELYIQTDKYFGISLTINNLLDNYDFSAEELKSLNETLKKGIKEIENKALKEIPKVLFDLQKKDSYKLILRDPLAEMLNEENKMLLDFINTYNTLNPDAFSVNYNKIVKESFEDLNNLFFQHKELTELMMMKKYLKEIAQKIENNFSFLNNEVIEITFNTLRAPQSWRSHYGAKNSLKLNDELIEKLKGFTKNKELIKNLKSVNDLESGPLNLNLLNTKMNVLLSNVKVNINNLKDKFNLLSKRSKTPPELRKSIVINFFKKVNNQLIDEIKILSGASTYMEKYNKMNEKYVNEKNLPELHKLHEELENNLLIINNRRAADKKNNIAMDADRSLLDSIEDETNADIKKSNKHLNKPFKPMEIEGLKTMSEGTNLEKEARPIDPFSNIVNRVLRRPESSLFAHGKPSLGTSSSNASDANERSPLFQSLKESCDSLEPEYDSSFSLRTDQSIIHGSIEMVSTPFINEMSKAQNSPLDQTPAEKGNNKREKKEQRKVLFPGK